MSSTTIRSGLASTLAALLLVPLGASAGVFPTVLSGNTTGHADSFFTGPPDDSYVGLGIDDVTYDFGVTGVLNRPGLVDLNVYEVDTGAPEFSLIDVLVSKDGTTFTSIKSSQVALVRTAGDSKHGNDSFGRSYDFGAFDWVRYVRVDGIGSGRAGGSNDFDLDAIGAHAARPIPEPSTWALMFGGLASLAGLRRRRG